VTHGRRWQAQRIAGGYAMPAAGLCARRHIQGAAGRPPLFLQAQKLGLTVPTANIAEFDYLLQLVPAGRVLFCSACRQTSIQPRGAVVIPPRPKEAIDDDPVASHGIEDAMLLVAWDQREGARHFTEADGAVFEFRNKRHGLHRVVRGDVACDRQKIIARVSGQGNSH